MDAEFLGVEDVEETGPSKIVTQTQPTDQLGRLKGVNVSHELPQTDPRLQPPQLIGSPDWQSQTRHVWVV